MSFYDRFDNDCEPNLSDIAQVLLANAPKRTSLSSPNPTYPKWMTRWAQIHVLLQREAALHNRILARNRVTKVENSRPDGSKFDSSAIGPELALTGNSQNDRLRNIASQ
ncbi:MAG: hypothetical protein EB015_15690 [Methylocystaceae bacterium]|nr:hypothetical protein [Methylocystaceae bacterium]